MNRMILTAVLCVSIAGCSPGQVASTVSAALLPPEMMAKIAGLCRQGEPLIRLAGALPMPAAGKEIAAFIAGYCDPLLAGSVPPTTDANTPAWLDRNLAGLRTLLGR